MRIDISELIKHWKTHSVGSDTRRMAELCTELEEGNKKLHQTIRELKHTIEQHVRVISIKQDEINGLHRKIDALESRTVQGRVTRP